MAERKQETLYLGRSRARSRHRPLAVVDGSVTKNLNKTGVRLWTESNLDSIKESGECDPGDASFGAVRPP
jgi:hypothetical protein